MDLRILQGSGIAQSLDHLFLSANVCSTEKLQQVTKLVDSLEKDLKDNSLNSARKQNLNTAY
jgi:hypothetical protein